MTWLPPLRAALIVGVLLSATPASAQQELFAIPFGGVKFGGSTSIIDLELAAGKTKLVVGIAARLVTDSFIGYEVEFGTVSGYFENEETARFAPLAQPGSYARDLTGSVILTLPPQFTGGGLRPYVAVGGGIINVGGVDVLDIFKVRRTVPAINVGVGATGLFTNNVGVRFDVRHLRSLYKEPSSGAVGRRISYSRFTVGLLLRL